MISMSGKFEELVAMMEKLREPGGCPWDLEQDWKSLRQYVIEEAYEVVDAIDSGDPVRVEDECGDLLLQVVFLSRIAQEQGLFDVYGAIDAILDKLVRRHPHVFGDVVAETSQEVLKNWEKLKEEERKTQGQGGGIDGVALALPALLRAWKLGKKASRVGFDWEDVSGALGKVEEEMGELREAITDGKQGDVAHEYGDVLFALCQVGRFLGLNPEDSLREGNARFEHRFNVMEGEIQKEGKRVADFDLTELESRWQAAKKSL